MIRCTTKWPVRTNKDSDQQRHPPSLISLRCALTRKLTAHGFFMRTAKIGQMPRLIGVFAGCPGHLVGFVVFFLLCSTSNIYILKSLEVELYQLLAWHSNFHNLGLIALVCGYCNWTINSCVLWNTELDFKLKNMTLNWKNCNTTNTILFHGMKCFRRTEEGGYLMVIEG